MAGIVSSNLRDEERLLLWIHGGTSHGSGQGCGVSSINSSSLQLGVEIGLPERSMSITS